MRKDLSAGIQVDFTAADKVTLSVKALQNQTIGIVGTQLQAKTVDAATQARLTTLNQTELTTLMTQISQATTAQANYLHMAYDLNGAVVTNFYVGLVVTMDKVPNNGQNLINALNLKYPYLAPLNLKYDAYIIGKPPIGTFHYRQIIVGETSKAISSQLLVNQYGSLEAAKAEFENLALANLKAIYEAEYAKNNYNVNIISASITESSFSTFYAATVKYTIGFELTLDSDRAFQNSPIAPVVLAIILIGVVALGVTLGVTVPAAIADWLKSMTTKTWNSRQDTYGWVINPNTGEWEWKLTGTKEESGSEPDLGGTSLIIIGAVAIVAVIMILLGFKGGKGKGH